MLENRAVLDELARLRDAGLAVGLTLSGPRQGETLARALEIEVAGQPLFAAVQATWNLLEPSAGPLLAAAHAAGMGVIVKEALANGRLTPRNQEPAFAVQRRLLDDTASSLGVTIDALALAAVLAPAMGDRRAQRRRHGPATSVKRCCPGHSRVRVAGCNAGTAG